MDSGRRRLRAFGSLAGNRTFAIHPDYLDGDAVHGAGEVNFADRGLQLSRGFRALKVWVTVHMFGLSAFRACIQRNLDLAGS